jgi:tRNA pseudouridine38-40 synthase
LTYLHFHCRFSNFFNHIDHYQNNFFLYCTSGGIAAVKLISTPTEKGASKGEGNKADKGQSAALGEVESLEDEGELPTGGEEGN